MIVWPHRTSCQKISNFIEIVNRFFENKKMILRRENDQNVFEMMYADKHTTNNLSSLSSGERQIATIFYAISQLSSQGIVLMDEPEISLHLDWQRSIVRNISQMLAAEQIIACTHSPAIGGDYEMTELEFRFVG